jgi:hypothetical protein
VSAVDDLEAKARLAAVEWDYGEGNATPALLDEATDDEVAFFLKLLRSARADGKREGLEEAAEELVKEQDEYEPQGDGWCALSDALERIRALKDTNG